MVEVVVVSILSLSASAVLKYSVLTWDLIAY